MSRSRLPASRRRDNSIHRTECAKGLALRCGDAGQPGDVHALVEAVRAQAAQLDTTWNVPETYCAVASPTRYEPTVATHCHTPHPRGVSLEGSQALAIQRIPQLDR